MSETEPSEQGVEALLDYLKRNRGFDFTGYKRTSLMRRIQKRMQTVAVAGYDSYIDFLEVHPEEFGFLFDTVLINVTTFFRDVSAWEHLASDIVPAILHGKAAGAPIRIWSAGCASGEEAFSLAMALAEALGEDAFRERVKIYATDIDDEALNQARQATYSERDSPSIPPPYLKKYFEQHDSRIIFRKDLRRSVIFGRHDLIQDAPISRMDLLACRNTLMYLNAETQNKILARFHFALSDGGYLFLGKAETLLTHSNLFVPSDLKNRFFTKVARITLRDRLLSMAQSGSEIAMNDLAGHVRIREAAFDSSSVAQVVIDLQGVLALTNERARLLFSLSADDIGRPLQDFELSYRPVELRSLIEQAYSERRPIIHKDVEWRYSSSDTRWIDLHVVPLFDAAGNLLGTSVAFTDVSRYKRLQDSLEHSGQELETAHEELQSTVEELETTNEELQSTIEELETTNEELQSTNEELETMNEELQSTNEELETMNEELHRRSEEINEINSFLQSILTSLHDGVVVLDSEMRVRAWNRKAEDLWGLRDSEVMGKHLLGLDIGLPMEGLLQPIRASLAGESDHQETILSAVNRRGRPIRCRVMSTPLTGRENKVIGIILVMEELA